MKETRKTQKATKQVSRKDILWRGSNQRGRGLGDDKKYVAGGSEGNEK